MIRKALTYLTILAITALPVQLISANAESVNMQMSMSQKTLSNKDCLRNMSTEESKTVVEKSCCNDEQLRSCQGCNDVPQAAGAMVFSASTSVKFFMLNSTKLFAGNSQLHGVPQKNLLRPPRTTI